MLQQLLLLQPFGALPLLRSGAPGERQQKFLVVEPAASSGERRDDADEGMLFEPRVEGQLAGVVEVADLPPPGLELRRRSLSVGGGFIIAKSKCSLYKKRNAPNLWQNEMRTKNHTTTI